MPVSDPYLVARRLTSPGLSLEAHLNDPCDEPIAQLGEHDCTMPARVIPSALAVLRVAAQIEPDPGRVLDWYRHVWISELGFLTARQLVRMGRASMVIDFLQSIRCGQRG